MMSCDAVVVGGGHAGAEAARVLACKELDTILLTDSLESLGRMSCNPAIGGLGKGHLVREIDALGGLMARAADDTGIHFRVLGASRGPAVQGLRSQNDRQAYHRAVRAVLESVPGLRLLEGRASGIRVEGGRAVGVELLGGGRLLCRAVILTTGTCSRRPALASGRGFGPGRGGHWLRQWLACAGGRCADGAPARRGSSPCRNRRRLRSIACG